MSRGRFGRFAAVEDSTFAALGTGAYDGQRKRVIDVGNKKFQLEWDASDGFWWPVGHQQPYYVGAVVTDTNSSGLQTLTFPNVAHPANFWRPGLGLLAELFVETSIAATARTFQLTLGTEDVTNLPTAANRRVSGRFGFLADGASSGWTFSKKDANEYDMPGSANTNVSVLTQAWSGALTLGGSATFTTAASAATAKLRRFRLSLIRG